MSKSAGKAGWAVNKISDVAVVFDGPHATPKTIEAGPIFLGIGALQDGTINLGEMRHVTAEDFQRWTRRVRPQANDVVFSYETKLGEAAIIPEGLDCCLGRRMGLVRLDEKRVVPRFFLYQYISPLFRDFLSDRTIRGATVDRISIKEFPAFPITVPPLPEQQRIVGILDEAFDGIATAKANAEKNLQNARALFESHLQEVFTRSGEGWVQKRLSDICTEITVGHVGLMAKQYKGSGIPFLRSQNIRPFRVTLENVVFIDEVFHSSLSKSQLRPGDLAIVRTGYPGTAAVIPDTLKTSNCSDLVIVRPGNHVDPHYLAAFFNSSYGKGMVIGKLVGAAQRHFNVAAAKNVLIHLPPLTEQRGVVSAITASRLQTQRLESIYRQKLAALDSLKKSLLDQAFNGLL